MIGQLARTSLGRYDLPLPTSDQPSIVIVAPNVDTFEAEWSLDRDDVRFAVVVHEVVHAAIRTVPWLLDRLVELATAYAAAYRVDPNAIESAIGSVDPADPASYSNLAADPTVLLGAMQSPEQIGIRARLQLLMSVVEGYADVVIAKVATPLIPSYPQIHEAVKRHRLDRGDAGAMIEALLGIELDREHYEQGEAFCTGVIERAGLDGLNRLWTSVEMLPTPNELAAPGLWLARIDLPLDDDADATDPAGPSTPPDPPA
jgi:putative hydrolase